MLLEIFGHHRKSSTLTVDFCFPGPRHTLNRLSCPLTTVSPERRCGDEGLHHHRFDGGCRPCLLLEALGEVDRGESILIAVAGQTPYSSSCRVMSVNHLMEDSAIQRGAVATRSGAPLEQRQRPPVHFIREKGIGMECLRERDAAREEGHLRPTAGRIPPLKLHTPASGSRTPAAENITQAGVVVDLRRCRLPRAPIEHQAPSDHGMRVHCRCIAGPPDRDRRDLLQVGKAQRQSPSTKPLIFLVAEDEASRDRTYGILGFGQNLSIGCYPSRELAYRCLGVERAGTRP